MTDAVSGRCARADPRIAGPRKGHVLAACRIVMQAGVPERCP
jgi:hypothetical protein